MHEFFNSQMDYVFFLYGLAFIILGISCLSAPKSENSPLLWRLLGLFGIFHGALEWLDLVSIVFGDSSRFVAVRTGIMIISYIFLVQFGCTGIKTITGKGPGWRLTGFLLIAASMGYLAGFAGLNALSRYTLGLGGGVLTCTAFFLYRKDQAPETHRWLTIAGIAMMMYAIFTGVITPKAPFFPASVINQEMFFMVTGIPIQVFRTLAAVVVSISLVFVRARVPIVTGEQRMYADVRERYARGAAWALLAVIIFGWFQTNISEQRGERKASENLAFRIQSIQSTIHIEDVNDLLLSEASPDLKAYNDLKSHLMAVHEANKDCRGIYLLAVTEDKFRILADSDISLSEVNRLPLLAQKPTELIKNKNNDEPFTVGPYFTEHGILVSALAPVKLTGHGATSVFVGFDVIADGWAREISLSRFNAIIITFFISFSILMLTLAWCKNREAAMKIAELKIEKYKEEAQEALRESEERYRTIFEKNANPILVIDMEGNYIAGNQAALDFLEVSQEKLLTMNVVDFLPPGEEQIIEQHKLLWNTGGVVETTYYINGKMKTLELTINSAELSGQKVCFAMGKDVTNRKEAEEKIKFMAYHDTLTNLPNRTFFQERVRSAMDSARSNNHLLAILFLDLDRFKVINDTLGHCTGDKLLREIAGRLKSCIGEESVVSRQGGDEFTVLLSRIEDIQEAASVAEKILEEFEEPLVVGNREFLISASIGITVFPNDGQDVDTLLKNADISMYRAKGAGGKTYQFYNPSMSAMDFDRMEMENNLRTALERGEFEVYYQPQVSISTGEIVGMEALVRWNHPTRGLVPPDQFIPLAEETGLIVPIGEWVMRTACAQVKKWHDEGYPKFRVAVNLSARQFKQSDLPRVISEILQETQLDPRYLELEITETTAMQNMDYTTKTIKEFKEMGIGISLDDFGTGYCSLNYLRRFPPIDALKIDQSFIGDVTSTAEDKTAALVSTIMVLARKLNLKVIAEGVETNDQLAFLKQKQCDEMQGFLISRPLPARAVERLLSELTEASPSDVPQKIATGSM